MARSKSETGRPWTDVCPVVVMLGDVEMASVFCAVFVRVADEGRLPVVVEVAVGDSDPFWGVCDIDEAVVVVFVVIEVGGKFAEKTLISI